MTKLVSRAVPSGGVLTNTQGVSIGTDDVHGGVGGAGAILVNIASADFGVVETTITSRSVTPTNAQNTVYLPALPTVTKTVGAGDVTLRIKEAAVVIASAVIAGMAIGDIGNFSLRPTQSDVTVALHTYDFTIQSSTAGVILLVVKCSAAQFSLEGVASCSACICS